MQLYLLRDKEAVPAALFILPLDHILDLDHRRLFFYPKGQEQLQ